MKNPIRSGMASFALLAATALLATTATAQTTPTWTFQPVLKRLNASEAELPSGDVDLRVRNKAVIRVGFFMKVTTTASGTDPIGFDSLSGAIHFTSSRISDAHLGTFLGTIPNYGATESTNTVSAGNRGWFRRWAPPTTTSSSSGFVDSGNSVSGTTWTIPLWGDTLETNIFSPRDERGAWCTPDASKSCEINLGVLVVPLSAMPAAAGGPLSLKFASVGNIANNPTLTAMLSGGTVAHTAGNTIDYNVCPAAGCPVTVNFASNAYSVDEGDGSTANTVTVTATLSQPYASAITIPIAARTTGTGMGTAPTTAYTLPSPSQMVFASRQTSQTFTVTTVPNDDDAAAAAEEQTVVLDFGTLPNVVVAGATTSTTITIRDDDFPSATVVFGAASYAATEGGDVATVTVTVTAPASPGSLERDVVIPITTTRTGDATPADFSGVASSLTFVATSAGTTSQTFEVTATDDSAMDPNEGLTLEFGTLPKDVAAGTQSTTSVALRDDDSDLVEISVPDGSTVSEDGGAQTIVVTGTLRVAQATSSQIVVDLGTEGTATEGSGNDYTFGTASLTFPTNSADATTVTANLVVTPVDDGTVEAVETIVVTGSESGTSPVLDGISKSGAINFTDDDTATVSISAASATVAEGADGTGQADTASASFTAAMTAPVATAVTVSWSATTDGDTGTEDADPDADLVSKSGNVVIAAGATTQTFSVSIENDELSEVDETFRTALGAVTGAPARTDNMGDPVQTVTIAAGAAAYTDVTITKNDPLTVALEAPRSLLEGRLNSYTLRVSGGLPTTGIVATVTASIDTSGGSATQTGVPTDTGCDGSLEICLPDRTDPATSTVTIAANASTGTYTLRVADDGRGDEDDEVTVTVTDAVGGRGAATNTDGLTVAPTSPTQPGGPRSQTVTLVSEAHAVSIDADNVQVRIASGTTTTTTAEEGSTFIIPVEVSGVLDAGVTLTVGYALGTDDDDDTLDAALTGEAPDFGGAVSGSVAIGRGQCDVPTDSCSANIEVAVADDALAEEDEVFNVMLTGVTRSSTSGREAVIDDSAKSSSPLTIRKSDPILTVAIGELPGRGQIREGRTVTYPIRSYGGVPGEPITVSVDVSIGGGPTTSTAVASAASASVASAASASATPAESDPGPCRGDEDENPHDACIVAPDGQRFGVTPSPVRFDVVIPKGEQEAPLTIYLVRDDEDDAEDRLRVEIFRSEGGRATAGDAPASITNLGDLTPGDKTALEALLRGSGVSVADLEDVLRRARTGEDSQIEQVLLVSIHPGAGGAMPALDDEMRLGPAEEGETFWIPVVVDDLLRDNEATVMVSYVVCPGEDAEAGQDGKCPESESPASEMSDVNPTEGTIEIRDAHAADVPGMGRIPRAYIKVMAAQDLLSEGPETFTVNLTGVKVEQPEGSLVNVELDEDGEVGGPTGGTATRVTIAPSDPLTVSFTGPVEAREKTTATYTVSITEGVSTAPVTVPIVLDPLAPLPPNQTRPDLPDADAADVSGLPETVTVASGQASRTFDVDIVREPGSAREGKELLVLRLGDLSGGGGGGLVASEAARSVGTVITEVNLEERGKAMTYTLAAFGRTVASNMVEAIEGRAAAVRSSGGSRATLAGEELSLDALRFSDADDADDDAEAREALRKVERLLGVTTDGGGGVTLDPVSSEELLSGSSFHLTGGGHGIAETWSVWGGGSIARFKGEPEPRFSMDGDVTSGQVGFDFRARADVLAGVALNHSEGETDYRFIEGTKGTIDTTLTSVHPYVHWSPRERLGVWGMMGAGKGTATLDDGDSDPVETDLGMWMGAAGARNELTRWGTLDWALKADAFHVRIESEERKDLLPAVGADAYRMRAALEGSRSWKELEGVEVLTGNVELGARKDGGDADDGLGMELGGGLTYTHPEQGLDVSARGRGMLAHKAFGFQEWGFSLAASYDPGAPGRGLHLSVEPAWGNSASGVDEMWRTARLAEAAQSGESGGDARPDDPDMALAARAGYGLGLMDNRALLTPFGATTLTEENSRVRLGSRLTWSVPHGTGLELELYGEREGGAGADDDAVRSVTLDSRVKRGFGKRDVGAVELFGTVQTGDVTDHRVGLRLRMGF